MESEEIYFEVIRQLTDDSTKTKKILKVQEIKSQGYSVYVGDVLEQLQTFLENHTTQYSKFFILVDENTHKHCLPQVLHDVHHFADAEIIEIESGEANKCIDVVTQVWMTLSEAEADRKALFVNLGGGVIGDMGGFIASTYKRGIDFLNIPTTLLSQVDASVGGKLGIDLNGLKNQIGVFNFPQGVFVHTPFLSSLPFSQIRSGWAEVLKHALIRDKQQWNNLKGADLHKVDWNKEIAWSVGIKNEIVLEDPREKGVRKLLNFGHTIGHAIETLSIEHIGLKDLLHGEAIGAGMIAELYLSHKLAGLSKTEMDEVVDVLVKLYEPVALREEFFDSYVQLMGNDKKNEGGLINFTLLKSIGEGVINYTADKAQIIESLKYFNSVVKNA